MSSIRYTTEKALKIIRGLPRVTLANIRDNPQSKQRVRILSLFIFMYNRK